MGAGRSVGRLLIFTVISALLAALGARLLDEMLAVPRRGDDWSAAIELEETVLPGISLRS